MTICWLITELSEHAESLPCRELNNSECDRISSVIEVNCQTSKEAKRVDRKCDHLPSYNRTVECVEQWCGKWEPFKGNKKKIADQPARNESGSSLSSALDVFREVCAYGDCDECLEELKPKYEAAARRECIEAQCCAPGSGAEQLNQELYVMLIKIGICFVFHIRLIALFE